MRRHAHTVLGQVFVAEVAELRTVDAVFDTDRAVGLVSLAETREVVCHLLSIAGAQADLGTHPIGVNAATQHRRKRTTV